MSNASLEERLFSSLENACLCLEKENIFLINGSLEEVVKHFPLKKEIITLLEENLSLIGENKINQEMRENFQNLFECFNTLSEKNRILLEAVIDTQNKILKMLLIPEKEESKNGYSSFGEYNKMNDTHPALAIKSDV